MSERLDSAEQAAREHLLARLEMAQAAGGIGIHDYSIVHDRIEWDVAVKPRGCACARRKRQAHSNSWRIHRHHAPYFTAFVASFERRIGALVAAQRLLTDRDWRSADIGDIARSVLAPFNDRGETRITLNGPALQMEGSDVVSAALALHKLLLITL
ncbi:MAG: hypothetical protein HC794_05745 [Nitrospiraceae bacterium]|nr:hypothetical protein [Nitrospiraceae bacterium]